MKTTQDRHFLFLQGPHGPFWARLGAALLQTGARVCRIGFNAGDEAFWPRNSSYIPYTDTLDKWQDKLATVIRENAITDLVIYGDIRPVHAAAVAKANDLGVTVHVFEEGYIRPYWVSYERGGSNGNSRLMQIDVETMSRVLGRSDQDLATPPAHWGDMRQHVFYGAFYHWHVLFRNGRYRNFTRHRKHHLRSEALAYTKQLLLLPWIAIERRIATRRLLRSGAPYHVALLQLEHDASFLAHAPFARMEDFFQKVLDGFAQGAPAHHHLVFKAHPLEPGYKPYRRIITDMARVRGLQGRVHYLRGSKLASLLDNARSAVTVNSTAAMQVLWRNLPLKVFGKSVYAKPELVSDQPLDMFFAAPNPPQHDACVDFRRYLLETSQVPGGFYSARGRRQLLREVVDMMLLEDDPYTARERTLRPVQNGLRLVVNRD